MPQGVARAALRGCPRYVFTDALFTTWPLTSPSSDEAVLGEARAGMPDLPLRTWLGLFRDAAAMVDRLKQRGGVFDLAQFEALRVEEQLRWWQGPVAADRSVAWRRPAGPGERRRNRGPLA